MTNNVHRVLPDAAVKPVVFSHESSEESVIRPVTGEQARHMHFSAPAKASGRTSPQ